MGNFRQIRSIYGTTHLVLTESGDPAPSCCRDLRRNSSRDFAAAGVAHADHSSLKWKLASAICNRDDRSSRDQGTLGCLRLLGSRRSLSSGQLRRISIEHRSAATRFAQNRLNAFRGWQMKAARVLRFGPPSVITNDDVPRPEPGAGQLLVRVKAAGVGHWDALIREGKVELEPLPLVLGSELSGIVEAIGVEVSGFKIGDEVYGATNAQFSGAYAEYAVPSARMMAQKPKTLNFIEAASAPIVTVTAWQALFDYAR